jgi:hypothetical protein
VRRQILDDGLLTEAAVLGILNVENGLCEKDGRAEVTKLDNFNF